MKTHILKIDKEPYFAVRHGFKSFEIRKNDRNFAVDDIVVLMPTNEEWPPIMKQITYITIYEQKDDYIVFGMKDFDDFMFRHIGGLE